MKCEECDGTGRAIKESNPVLRDNICSCCNGTGEQPEPKCNKPEELKPEEVVSNLISKAAISGEITIKQFGDCVDFLREAINTRHDAWKE